LKSSNINQIKTETKAIKRKFRKDEKSGDSPFILKLMLSKIRIKDHHANEKNQVFIKLD
jgi:hypothetical protein